LDTAIDLSQTVHQISVLYDPMLCEAWKLIEEETPGVAQSQDSLPVLINQLNCDQ
jgi:hypothetical protein